MTDKERQAYDWAKNQNYQSVAAQYAKLLTNVIDHLQTALDAANKRAEAAIADINLLDTRGWLCKHRDGGACIKDGMRQICTYGTCSANACKEKIWRGPQGCKNMV